MMDFRNNSEGGMPIKKLSLQGEDVKPAYIVSTERNESEDKRSPRSPAER